MYKRIIYSSTLQGNVYITLIKILAAIYNNFNTDIKENYFKCQAQLKLEILEAFSGISSKLNTEYNFDNKNTEFSTNEQLVAFSETFGLEDEIKNLFNAVLGNLPKDSYFEIEIIEDIELTPAQRLHINRLFGNYIKFTFTLI